MSVGEVVCCCSLMAGEMEEEDERVVGHGCCIQTGERAGQREVRRRDVAVAAEEGKIVGAGMEVVVEVGIYVSDPS